MNEAYPARDTIEKRMKTHAATVANIDDCHPRFRKPE
jgi:hypothetical protein